MPEYSECTFRTVDVSLTIPITIAAKTGVDVLLSELGRLASHDGYDEGRYPFPRELLQLSLEMLLRGVVYDSVVKFMQTKYGSATAPSGQAVAYAKAQEWMRDDFYSVHASLEDWKVSLTSPE